MVCWYYRTSLQHEKAATTGHIIHLITCIRICLYISVHLSVVIRLFMSDEKSFPVCLNNVAPFSCCSDKLLLMEILHKLLSCSI